MSFAYLDRQQALAKLRKAPRLPSNGPSNPPSSEKPKKPVPSVASPPISAQSPPVTSSLSPEYSEHLDDIDPFFESGSAFRSESITRAKSHSQLATSPPVSAASPPIGGMGSPPPSSALQRLLSPRSSSSQNLAAHSGSTSSLSLSSSATSSSSSHAPVPSLLSPTAIEPLRSDIFVPTSSGGFILSKTLKRQLSGSRATPKPETPSPPPSLAISTQPPTSGDLSSPTHLLSPRAESVLSPTELLLSPTTTNRSNRVLSAVDSLASVSASHRHSVRSLAKAAEPEGNIHSQSSTVPISSPINETEPPLDPVLRLEALKALEEDDIFEDLDPTTLWTITLFTLMVLSLMSLLHLSALKAIIVTLFALVGTHRFLVIYGFGISPSLFHVRTLSANNSGQTSLDG